MLFSCSRILSLSGAIFGGSSGYPRCLVESDDAQDSQLTDIVGELAAKLLTLELSLQKKDEELTQVRQEFCKVMAKPAGLHGHLETVFSPPEPTAHPAKQDNADLKPETPKSNSSNGT